MSEVRIRIRRGLASEWTQDNPTLGLGEVGFETDTGKQKVGDGTTAWNSLSYSTVSRIITSDESVNSTFYPVFVSDVGNNEPKVKVTSTALTFNPSTSTLTAGTFSGDLSGNATTATTAGNVTGTVAVANGGTGATTAGNARTNLGATTVGSSLFTLANPSAVRFLRINSDNTVSALTDSDFRTAIGVGTGTGTVTSVGGTGTVSGLTLSGSVTTTGDLTLGGTLSVTPSNFSSQTANTFLAAPTGTAGVPTFRAIVAADVPTLNQNTTGTAANITASSNTTLTSLTNLATVGTITTGTWNAGTIAIARGGTGATTQSGARTNLGATTIGSNLFTLTNPGAVTFPRFNANNTVTARTAADFRSDIGAGTGTVTSIATNNGITGGTITTTGTVGLTGQALALHNLNTNGVIVRTDAGTVAGRTITAGIGISVTNGNGVAGNPTVAVDPADVVTSISGTVNQITASSAAGGVTLSTPQNIHTAATPTFGGATLNGSLGMRAAATTSAATQIPVFTATPATTTQTITTRTPAQLRGDIGAASTLHEHDAAAIISGTLINSVIPDLDADKITSGIFNVAQIPTINLTNKVTGTLPITNGGTGQTTYTNGQLLIGTNTGNTLVKGTLTGTTNRIIITNGAGSITINADATSANTVNKIVARDGSGNFSAGTITATLNGNASSSDFADNALTADLAEVAEALQFGREINGTSFNGTQNITTANWGTARNISIGGTSKSVNGSGNVTWTTSEIDANTATKLATAVQIGGVSFDGSNNINLPGVNQAGNQNTTGNAATATTLATARSINGTNFNGSGDITTANWGTSRTLTIGSSSKSVNGSGNVSWSLSEIGAAATNQTMFIGTTSVAINRTTGAQTLNGVSIDGNATTATDLSRSVIAGNGLTGGGQLNANVTLTVGQGDGISISSTAVAVDSTVVRISTNQSISGVKTFSGNIALGSLSTTKSAGYLYSGTTNPTENHVNFRVNYDGHFYATQLHSGGSFVFSDRALKADIEDWDGANLIKSLMPKMWKWKHDNSDGIGFVAQEVPQEFKGPDGLSIDYAKITAALVSLVLKLEAKLEGK